MQNQVKHNEERTHEEYTASVINHFGATSFEEDSLEHALNDYFQNA